ncbi:MAG: type II toxin-antitoxin system toxin DNA ADP-ribosyl transferase DarT [Terrimicrobiaceae bacterium]
MSVPNPTPIFRIVHVDCLRTILRRGALRAANHTPDDGLPYRTIHNVDIQGQRHIRNISCGPRGTLHDYVPFYFGYLSPMLLQLKTGRVAGYNEGQEPLIYLKTTVQAVRQAGLGFVFSDGHGIAAFTDWFDDTARLNEVDWEMVYQRYWSDNVNDMDRQRRKQAEFLIGQACPWALIEEIGVLNTGMKARVETIQNEFDAGLHKVVNVRAGWYY